MNDHRHPPPGPGPNPMHVAPHAELTEVGLAATLANRHGADLRFCHAWGRWLVWTGSHWQIDETGEMQRRARSVLAYLLKHGADLLALPNESDRKRGEALVDFARKAHRARTIASVLEVARSMVPVTPAELDSDPWALTVQNGTIDLRTGELRAHRREDLSTHCVPIDYEPNALCPRWTRFLWEVADQREELVDYLQRIAGYVLTGSIREHAVFLLTGSGANGKTVFVTTLQYLLGDLATIAAPGLLMVAKGDRHPTELRDLFGRRLVVTEEVPRGSAFSEERIKSLTGGADVKGRGMREDFTTFKPTHKLLITANDRPRVRDTSEGFWRRLRVVPFDVSFLGREDRELPEKLRAEAPGILRWAVEGCSHWLAEGLGQPVEVQEATSGYRDAEDIAGRWLSDWLDEHGLALGWVASKDILEHHRAWAEEGGERPLSGKALGAELQRRGWEPKRSPIASVRARGWVPAREVTT